MIILEDTRKQPGKHDKKNQYFSEHGIEIFNVGEKPFVLENFVICYKKKILVDCQMPESDRIILPFHNVVYTLSEQEADALEWHCQMEYFEECQVTAISIEKKKAKGILPVPLFAIRSNISSIGINKKE